MNQGPERNISGFLKHPIKSINEARKNWHITEHKKRLREAKDGESRIRRNYFTRHLTELVSAELDLMKSDTASEHRELPGYLSSEADTTRKTVITYIKGLGRREEWIKDTNTAYFGEREKGPTMEVTYDFPRKVEVDNLRSEAAGHRVEEVTTTDLSILDRSPLLIKFNGVFPGFDIEASFEAPNEKSNQVYPKGGKAEPKQPQFSVVLRQNGGEPITTHNGAIIETTLSLISEYAKLNQAEGWPASGHTRAKA